MSVLFEQGKEAACGRGDVVGAKQRREHGDRIDAGGDELRGIGFGDAADRDDGQPECRARTRVELERRMHRSGFCAGGECGAEGHMVGPGVAGREGKLEAVVAGGAEQSVRPLRAACRRDIAVLFPQVQAVGADV